MTKVVSFILISALLLCTTIAVQTKSAAFIQARIKGLESAD